VAACRAPRRRLSCQGLHAAVCNFACSRDKVGHGRWAQVLARQWGFWMNGLRWRQVKGSWEQGLGPAFAPTQPLGATVGIRRSAKSWNIGLRLSVQLRVPQRPWAPHLLVVYGSSTQGQADGLPLLVSGAWWSGVGWVVVTDVVQQTLQLVRPPGRRQGALVRRAACCDPAAPATWHGSSTLHFKPYRCTKPPSLDQAHPRVFLARIKHRIVCVTARSDGPGCCARAALSVRRALGSSARPRRCARADDRRPRTVAQMAACGLPLRGPDRACCAPFERSPSRRVNKRRMRSGARRRPSPQALARALPAAAAPRAAAP
jgi:hypothetical protein